MRFLAPRGSQFTGLHVALTLFATATWLWTMTIRARLPMSVALIALAALSIVRVGFRWSPIQLWAGLLGELKLFFRRPDYAWPTLFLIAYALSICWSGDQEYAIDRLRYALPTFAIPAIFFVQRSIFSKWRNVVWSLALFFGVTMAATTAAYVVYNNLSVVAALGHGRPVPTPLGHVNFAAFLAFATLVGVYFFIDRGRALWQRLLAGGAALVFVTTLHLVAVRTGLVLLYVGLAIFLFRLSLKHFRPMVAVPLIAGVVASSLVLAMQIPAVERKVTYTLYDLEHIGDDNVAQFSDAARVVSFQAAWHSISENPLLGASRESIGVAIRNWYDAHGYDEAHHLPTNQYLFSWAHAGLLGLLGVLAILWAPLSRKGRWRQPLVVEFVVLTAAWCMVETPFESDIGGGLALAMIYLAKAKLPTPPKKSPEATKR